MWLDFISPTLITCQDSESHGGTPLGGDEMESSESSSFPLPYPQNVQAMGASTPPPKERRRAYPPIVKVMTLTRSRLLRLDINRHAERRRQKIPYPMKFPLTIPNIGGFFPKKEEPLGTSTIDLMPLLRVLLSGCNAFVAGPCLCFSAMSLNFQVC